MMKSETPRPELAEVLQEIPELAGRPDPSLLADLVQKHPHLAAELGDFFTEWFLQDSLPEPEPPTEGSEARTLEQVLQRFDSLSRAALEEPSVFANPFAGREPARLRSLAESIGLDKTVLAKLRDRKIEASTIPEELTLSLARELEVPLGAMLHHLNGPATIPVGASFKTKGKPTAGVKESFRVAIERSQLEGSSKARWLALAAARS